VRRLTLGQRLYLAALFIGLVVLALAGMAARAVGLIKPAARAA
jgi:hypothetical protein